MTEKKDSGQRQAVQQGVDPAAREMAVLLFLDRPMRKFKAVRETLDALEQEIALETKLARSIGLDFHPTPLIVALYRLAETQIELWARLGGTSKSPGPYVSFDEQYTRLLSHAALGTWILEQPE